MKAKIFYLFIVMAATLVSCKKEPLKDFYYLDRVISETQINKSELLTKLGMDPNSAVGKVLPDKVLKVVSLRYKTTDPKGKTIMASGIVTFPAVMPSYKEMGSVLGVHFTLGADRQAPSQRMASHESLFALFGYMVVAPDYVGYGASKTTVHPYHHYQYTSQASIDMLLAAKEYMASQSHRFPKNLTIMGYSEGGYASLACLKMIEDKYENWFKVREVFAGAGAYDLSASYEDFMKTFYSSQAATIPMLMLGLNYGDDLKLDLTKLFKKRLLDNYEKWILSKEYTTDQISDSIGSTDIREFLAPEVFDPNNENTKRFVESLAKNSVVRWRPNAKITLLHGTDDTIVPYVNTVNAYNSFKAQGCNVTLHPIPGKDHKPAGNDFYLYCMLKLISSTKGDGQYAELTSLLENNMTENLFNL